MSLEMKTLDEIWTENEASASLDLNLHKRKEEDRPSISLDRYFTIQGKMPYDDEGPAIYFGWYILEGKARLWSAYGRERPRDIYGKVRWVL